MWMHSNPLKKKYMTVSSVDVPMVGVSVQHLAKNAINAVVRTTLEKCVNPERALDPSPSLSQDMTQENQARPMASAHINAEYMK